MQSFLNDYDTMGEEDYFRAHFESKNSNRLQEAVDA